jgi:hypothetical protein
MYLSKTGLYLILASGWVVFLDLLAVSQLPFATLAGLAIPFIGMPMVLITKNVVLAKVCAFTIVGNAICFVQYGDGLIALEALGCGAIQLSLFWRLKAKEAGKSTEKG